MAKTKAKRHQKSRRLVHGNSSPGGSRLGFLERLESRELLSDFQPVQVGFSWLTPGQPTVVQFNAAGQCLGVTGPAAGDHDDCAIGDVGPDRVTIQFSRNIDRRTFNAAADVTVTGDLDATDPFRVTSGVARRRVVTINTAGDLATGADANLTLGLRDIKAKGKSGAWLDPWTMTVNVNSDQPPAPGNTPPRVLSVTPAAGAQLNESPSFIEALLSEDLDSPGQNGIQLFAAGPDGNLGTTDDVRINPRRVDYSAATDTLRFVVNGQVADGLYQARVMGSLRDGAGSRLDGNGDGTAGDDFVWTFRVASDPGGGPTDTTAPGVVSVTPNAGATLTQSPSVIEATLNEDLDPAHLPDQNSLQLHAAGADGNLGTADDVRIVPTRVEYSAATDVVRFVVNGQLANGAYRARLVGDSIRDAAGNRAADYAWTFGVNVPTNPPPPGDTSAPTVVSTNPSPGAIITEPLTAIDVVFNEDLDPATVTPANFVLSASGGDGTFGDGNETTIAPQRIEYSPATDTGRFVIGSRLPNDLFQLMLVGTASIRDLAGNKLDGDRNGSGGDNFTATFSVAVAPPPDSSPGPHKDVLGGDPPDAIADVFPGAPTPTLDISAISGFADPNNLYINVRFNTTPPGTTIEAPSASEPNSVFGFIDIDTDQDLITPSFLTNFDRTPAPISSTPGVGIEFVVDIGSEARHPGSVDVLYTDEKVPLAGNDDFDSRDDLYIYRPLTGEFLIGLNSGGQLGTVLGPFQFGGVGETPILGNWDPDGAGPLRANGGDDLGTFDATTSTFKLDLNDDRRLGEDRDGDGLLDPTEDLNNNGQLDVGEDANGNGLLDLSEDLNDNGGFTEDLNGNGLLDPTEQDLNNNGRADNLVDTETFVFGFAAPDPADQVLFGDWDEDGDTDIGVYRAATGEFLLDLNGNYEIDAAVTDPIPELPFRFGPISTTNVALVGDWNADGRTEVGVFVRGEDLNGDGFFNDGTAAPLLDEAADGVDYNGDGDALDLFSEDLNNNSIREDGTGFFFLDRDGDRVQDASEDANNNGVLDPGEDKDEDPITAGTQGNAFLDNDGPFAFGLATDSPVFGQWSVVGRDDIGVYRQGLAGGQYILDYNSDRAVSVGEGPFAFGGVGDRPVVGVFSFDGTSRMGSYTPTTRAGTRIGGDQFFIDTNGDRAVSPREGPFTLAPTAPIEFLFDSFTVKLPLSQLGNDPGGIVNFVATVGPFAGFSDEAPDPPPPPTPPNPPVPGTPAASGVAAPLRVVELSFPNETAFRLTEPLADALPKSTIAIPGTSVVVGTVGLQARLAGGDASLQSILDRRSVDARTVLLEGSGGDDVFGNGNDVSISANQIVVGTSPSAALIGKSNDTIFFDLTGVDLGADLYRFTLVGDDPIRDFHGVPLDGDFLDANGDGALTNADLPSGNGVPQGDFIATFRLDAPPEVISFRMTRPTDRNVDPLGAAPSDTGVIGDGITNTRTPNFVGVVSDDRLPIIGDNPGDTFVAGGQFDLFEGSGEFLDEDLNGNQLFNDGSTAPLLDEAVDGVDYNNDGDTVDSVSEDRNANGQFDRTIYLGLRFTTPVDLASSGATNAVRGFIDIDADQVSATGGTGWIRDLDGDRTEDFSDGIVHLGREGDVPIVGQWLLGAGVNPTGDRLGIFRPSTGEFFLDLDGDGRFLPSEDANGDGVFDPSEDLNGNGLLDTEGPFASGVTSEDLDGDGALDPGEDVDGNGVLDVAVPVVGNFCADNPQTVAVECPGTEVGVFRSGLWTIDLNGDREFADGSFTYGAVGDIAVVGNWNGLPGDEVGVVTPSTATLAPRWLLDRDGDTSAANDTPFEYGTANDQQIPVVGDWSGNGRTKVGTYSPRFSQWRIDINGNTVLEAAEGPFVFGDPQSQPVVGDWNGDNADDIGTYNTFGPTNQGTGQWFIDADHVAGTTPTLTSNDGPHRFGLVGEDRNNDGVLQTLEDLNGNDAIDPPDLPIVGRWETNGQAAASDLFGVFRLRDASHVNTFGFTTSFNIAGRADLGIEYFVDLASESGGVANLVDARTSRVVQAVPIRLFPDSRTVIVDIPLAAMPEVSGGRVTFGAIVGSATEFTDQLPELPRAAQSAESLQLDFATGQTPGCRTGSDGIFNDGTTFTRGFGTFTLQVPTSDQLSETVVGCLPSVVRVRATDLFDKVNNIVSTSIVDRGVRVDLTPPRIYRVIPPDNSQGRDGPRILQLNFSEDLNGNGILDPGEDTNGDNLLNSDDLDRSTAERSSSYELFRADEQPFESDSNELRQITYNSVTDSVSITLGEGLDSGHYTFVALSLGGITDVAGNRLDGEPNPGARPGQANVFPSGDDVAGGDFTTTLLINQGPPIVTAAAGSAGPIVRAIYDLNNEDINGDGAFDAGEDVDGDGTFDLGDAPAPPREIVVTLDQPVMPSSVPLDLNGNGRLDCGPDGICGTGDSVDLNGDGVFGPGDGEVDADGDGDIDFNALDEDTKTVFLTRTRTVDQITGLVSSIGDGVFDPFSNRVLGFVEVTNDGHTLTFHPNPEFLDPDNDGVQEGLLADHYRFSLMGGGILQPEPSGLRDNIIVSCDDFRNDQLTRLVPDTVAPSLACRTDNRDNGQAPTPFDPSGFQTTTATDLFVTNTLNSQGPGNVLLTAVEDRGQLFNVFDDEIAVYVSKDSGTSWAKTPFFATDAARTIATPASPTTTSVTFDIAVHPSVAFDALGTAYVGYALYDLPNVPDFTLTGADTRFDAADRDALDTGGAVCQDCAEVVDVLATADAATYAFEIGFSQTVTPPSENALRPLFGRLDIDCDRDGGADFFADLASENFDPAVESRFVNLLVAAGVSPACNPSNLAPGSLVSPSIPIDYLGDRVRLRVARELVDMDPPVLADFRVLVSQSAGGPVSDAAPNAGFTAVRDRRFRSSAVALSRSVDVVTAPSGSAVFQSPIPASFHFHEDLNDNGANDAGDIDVDGDGQITQMTFVDLDPSIAVDKTRIYSDRARTPNSNFGFVYVAFVISGVGDEGSLSDRDIYVARSIDALVYNDPTLGFRPYWEASTFERPPVALPNPGPITFDSLDPTDLGFRPNFLGNQANDDLAAIPSEVASPRLAVGALGQVYVIWQDYSQQTVSIELDRTFDTFHANLISTFCDRDRLDTPFNLPTGQDPPLNPADTCPAQDAPGRLPPPLDPTVPITWRGSNWSGADITVALSTVNGFDDPASNGENDTFDEKARQPVCDAPQFPDIEIITTNLFGSCYSIAAQPRGITTNARIALDSSAGPFAGRVYVAYTSRHDPNDPVGHDDTDVFLTFSDDFGRNWSTYPAAFGTPPIPGSLLQEPGTQVNDVDRGSQFSPALSVDPVTGDVYMAWYDTRNDETDFVRGIFGNEQAEVFFAVGRPETAGITFLQNQVLTTRPSDQSLRNPNRSQFAYGDYIDIVGVDGVAHPAWTDTRLILVDHTAVPQREEQIAEVMTARIDVNPAFEPADQTPAVTDVLGNALDGEPINESDTVVGLPSGDGQAGGNFVAGFSISDRILFADSAFEEDPLRPSTGTADNPFPTLRRAIDQANSIRFSITFDRAIALPSAGAGNRVQGFIDLDVDRRVTTPVVDLDGDGDAGEPEDTFGLSRVNLLGLGPTGLGTEFYIDLASEFDHPGAVDLLNSVTRALVARIPVFIESTAPDTLVVEVPRGAIRVGEFIPDRVNFAIAVGVDADGDGVLEPAELHDEAPNRFVETDRDHFRVPPPGTPAVGAPLSEEGDTLLVGATLDIRRVIVDSVPTRPVVVHVRDGRTPGGQPVPYVVQPRSGGLNGTITVGHFTDVEFEPGVVVKLRAANLDVAGDGSNVFSRGDVNDPVIFTSLFNDDQNVGGDTNGDLDNTQQRRGDWGGIVFHANTDDALSLVNFTRLEFGGGVVPRAAEGGLDTDVRPEAITLKAARPAVVNTVIAQSGAAPVTLEQNAQAGMSATPDSFADDTALPADGTGAGQRGPLLRDLLFRDNSINGLLVHADHDTGEAAFTSFVDARWDDTSVVHVLTSLMRVTQGTELVIDPGIAVKNRLGAIQIDGRGTLRVGGPNEADSKVVFTSVFDDTVIEDTTSDGAATVSRAGDWGSIFTVEPPRRFNLAVAEPGLEQRVIGGVGPTVIIDGAEIKFGGGLYVDNQVPSLGFGVTTNVVNNALRPTMTQCVAAVANCRPRSAVQLETPGYYQITNTAFRNNGLANNGALLTDPPLTVYANVLRPDIPFDIPTTFVDEAALNEDPLFRDNDFENNELDGMEVLPIFLDENGDRANDESWAANQPSEAYLLNTQFVDLDADGRLELTDGIDGLWNDTDVVHVVRNTIGLPGRVEVPGAAAGRFGITPFLDPVQFRDLILKVGKVDQADLLELDFESDALGAPLSPGQVIRPEAYNLSPFRVSIVPNLGLSTQLRIEGTQTNFSDLFALNDTTAGCVPDPELPGFVPTSGNNVLTTDTDGFPPAADGVTIRFNQPVYAVGLNIIGNRFVGLGENIEVVALDPNGVEGTFTTAFPLTGDAGSAFRGFISAFPIVELRLNEHLGDEDDLITAPVGCPPDDEIYDDVAYDDLVFSTAPVFPFQPTATQPSAALTLTSLVSGHELRTPLNEAFQTLSDAEGLVVKLSGAAPAATVTGALAFGDLPSQNRAFVGAGFQIGMDEGHDAFFDTDSAIQSNPTTDWGLGSAFRILGVPANEATGQPRVPVVLTSLRDDSEGPKGQPHNTDAVNDLTDQQGSLIGVPGAPVTGDWGDIFIGARSAGDRDDLMVRDLLGRLVADAQAVPGRAVTPNDVSTEFREDLLPATMDETQGSVILDARIKYGAKIRLQGASQISNQANSAAFGQEARNGRAILPNGRFPATCPDSPLDFSPGLCPGAFLAEDGSMVIAHNELLNLRDAGVIAHPGYFLAADAQHDNWVWVPSEPWVFNNVIAFIDELNGVAPTGTQGAHGVRIQGAAPPDCDRFTQDAGIVADGVSGVVMHNTIFGTQQGIELSPNAAALAINNIISDAGTGLTFAGCAGQTPQAGFNLFFNVTGAQQGLNNIAGNPLFNAPSLFLDPTTADFRLVPFSPSGQPNPAIDTAIGEFAPSAHWVNTIDDGIVRLPLPITVFNTSPLGPEKDLVGSVRQDDVRIQNSPPAVGVGAEVFFDIGAVESRDFGAPVVLDAVAIVGAQSPQLVPVGSATPLQLNESPTVIVVTLSEDLDIGTITTTDTGSVRLIQVAAQGPEQPVNILHAFDPATDTLTITPAQSLGDGRYRLELRGAGGEGLTDLDGVRLDGEFPGSQSVCQGTPLPSPCTDPATGYSSGDGLPGGNFVSEFTVGEPPRVESVTVTDGRADPVVVLGPPRGVDADFFPSVPEFRIDNPPTSIVVEFRKDVIVPTASTFQVFSYGVDGQPLTADDDLISGQYFPQPGATSKVWEFRPTVQGVLPTDTVWFVVLDGTIAGTNDPAIIDANGIPLDGEFLSGNEDDNRNDQIDPGEDRNNNGILDSGPDLVPSGDGASGGDFVGYFQVGDIAPPVTAALIVDQKFQAVIGSCPLNNLGIPFEVGTATCPFNTINEALEETTGLNSPKLIEVLPGTYFENVVVDSRHLGVTLRSQEGDADTIIEVAVGASNADGVVVDVAQPPLFIDRGSDVVVEGFQITSNGRTAVRIDVSDGTTSLKPVLLGRNTIFGNQTGVEILAGSGRVARLENNIIWANSGAGVEVRGGTGVRPAELVNNTVVFNQEGIVVRATSVGSPNIANIFNNIVVGSNGAGIRSVNTAGATIDFNDVYQNLGGNYINVIRLGEHNISADPLFLQPVGRPAGGRPDPSLADWQLGSLSPAIDAALGSEDVNQNLTLDAGEDLNGNNLLDAAPTEDHNRNARRDDLNVFDTGLGFPTFVDLGALERGADSTGAPGAPRNPGNIVRSTVAAVDLVISRGEYRVDETDDDEVQSDAANEWSDAIDVLLERAGTRAGRAARQDRLETDRD